MKISSSDNFFVYVIGRKLTCKFFSFIVLFKC
nr:MAG TPA: hypothetical protein [Bacteriophage sp.]